jgi:hypothetical protein
LPFRSFNNDHPDVDHEFKGDSFWIKISNTKHRRIEVSGHGNLWRIHDYMRAARASLTPEGVSPATTPLD